ncbi:hypothetical protein B0H10DRAFT_1956987 [Mycena sp. CBHHK59/15]|nr:hypothetical protein B0H10DRAFT_1956987 [Mycena sp. CBHHK59/15]
MCRTHPKDAMGVIVMLRLGRNVEHRGHLCFVGENVSGEYSWGKDIEKNGMGTDPGWDRGRTSSVEGPAAEVESYKQFAVRLEYLHPLFGGGDGWSRAGDSEEGGMAHADVSVDGHSGTGAAASETMAVVSCTTGAEERRMGSGRGKEGVRAVNGVQVVCKGDFVPTALRERNFFGREHDFPVMRVELRGIRKTDTRRELETKLPKIDMEINCQIFKDSGG